MLLLADLVLVVHFLFVLFVIAALPLTWVGALAGWRWVRHRRFRLTHLAAILLVTAESLAGVWCPLTVWEDTLRGSETEKGFVARWVHALMFYDFPPAYFTAAYMAFAAAVILTWWRIPPRRRQSK